MDKASGEDVGGKPARPIGYYANPRKEMLDFIPKRTKTVLEVRCGEGSSGAQLKALGMEVWGVEIDQISAAIARRNIDRVLTGDACRLLNCLPTGYFDCIVFNDVLEHLVDPFSLLVSIRSLLTANGVVVSSIPNVRHFSNRKRLLIDKQWQYEDWGILDRTHLRFFTQKSIRAMFSSLGYDIIRLEGISAFVPSWKFRALNILLLGNLSDTKYAQFACVAQ